MREKNIALDKLAFIALILENDTKVFRPDELRHLFLIAYDTVAPAFILREFFEEVFIMLLKNEFFIEVKGGFSINTEVQNCFQGKSSNDLLSSNFDYSLLN